MKSAILINDIKDAAYLATHRDLIDSGNCLVLSTHASVDVFLREKHKIKCNCLSSYLDSKNVADNIKLAYSLSCDTVKFLDDLYRNTLEEKVYFLKGMRFFRAFYSYQAYCQFIIYLNLLHSVRSLIKDNNELEKVVLFDKKIDYFLRAATSLSDILKFFKQIEIGNIVFDKDEPADVATDYFSRRCLLPKFRRLYEMGCRDIHRKAKDSIFKFGYAFFRSDRETILLSEPLCGLSFIHGYLRKYNVVYYGMDSSYPNGINNNEFLNYRLYLDSEKAFNNQSNYSSDEIGFIKNIVVHDILSDFNKNINLQLNFLECLDRLNKEKKIRLGIWGSSPVFGFRRLVFEYLIANGIPVIGCQHGGPMGNIYNTQIFLNDINRCTHYISSDFDRSDLGRMYPLREYDTKIYNFGIIKSPHKKIRRNKKVIDLVFPLTNNLSMLVDDMKREGPDILVEKQIKLTKFLDSVQGKDIMIKPFRLSNYENLAIYSLLEKTNNVKVMGNVLFNGILESFDVRSVLIENPSTALYEALAYDLEIFVLGDKVRPLEEMALAQLEKRVHYSEDTEEIISKIDLFFNGKLEKKRDDTFYQHYVYKDNSERNILSLIETLVNDR